MESTSATEEKIEEKPKRVSFLKELEIVSDTTSVGTLPSLPRWRVFSIMLALSATSFLVTLDAVSGSRPLDSDQEQNVR